MLVLKSVGKSFPGVRALQDVDLHLRAGQIHALVGENGAGKSTLIKIMGGVYRPDYGQMVLDSVPYQPHSAADGRRRGVIVVHQESELFPTLSVAENLVLASAVPTGRWGLIDWKKVYSSAQQAIDLFELEIDAKQPAATLSLAERQMAQLAIAVSQRARVIVFDEPTSALSSAETEWLFDRINAFRRSGVAVVYVSHRQEEIFRLADQISVLRDGRLVWNGLANDTNSADLVNRMVGRSTGIPAKRPSRKPAEESQNASLSIGMQLEKRNELEADHEPSRRPILAVRRLTHQGRMFRDVTFEVFPGEIVGIYGQVGAGRSEVARSIFGLDRLESGVIYIDGAKIDVRTPTKAMHAGLAYIPEDRLRQAILPNSTVRANAVIANLSLPDSRSFVSRKAEEQTTRQIVNQFDVRCADQQQSIQTLSGGNQQKVILGRWLATNPRVLILDEPTRGIDVGAKAEIHRLIRDSIATAPNRAAILISSELPEILEQSDRVIVFRDGQIVGEFSRGASAEAIAAAAIHGTQLVEKNSTQGGAVAPSDTSGRAKATLPAGSHCGEPVVNGDSNVKGKIQTKLWTMASRLTLNWQSQEASLLVVVLVLMLLLTVSANDQVEGVSFLNLATNGSIWTLLGIAASCTIVAGGIDISIGSLVGLSAAVAGLVMKTSLPEAVSIPLALLSGILVATVGGLLNGILSIWGRVHPIVVTLGTMTIFRGIVILLLGGKAMTDIPSSFRRLAVDSSTGFRGMIVFAGLFVAAAWIWLSRVSSGRRLFAVGSSSKAAELCGISRTRSWIVAFAMGGFFAGVAGVLQLAYSGQMQATLGNGWELLAIAVAVVGGFSITGGQGRVQGIILGALLLRLVNSALVRWGISGKQVDLVVGGLILAAVLSDLIWRRRSSAGQT